MANCQRKELRDDHLWIVDAQTHTRAQAVIAEVTPRWLASNPGWRLRFLKRLAHQRARVRLTGWRMLDPEPPEQLGKTRGGCGKSIRSRRLRSSPAAAGWSCESMGGLGPLAGRTPVWRAA